jgi:maleylacetoacetate isomerase/maleylpyruvate isomerase
MKLHTYFRSSASYRVRIALNLKGLQYESLPKMLVKGEQHTAEYLELNPQGLIPALEVEDGALMQSVAIIEYLDEQHPTPPLLPRDAFGRAQVRAMALAIACDIHPLNNLRVLNYLKHELHHEEASVDTWYRHWITVGFTALEAQTRRVSNGGRYCYADSLSLADVLLVPQMLNARRYQSDLSPFPTLVGICAHLEALPAFAAARPEVQPDAF